MCLKTSILLTALTLASPALAADVEGVVRDHRGRPVARAVIEVPGGPTAVSDEEGAFVLVLEAGTHRLRVRHPAYETLLDEVRAGESTVPVELVFQPPAVAEAITVSAIRAGDEVPVTKKNLDLEAIEERSYGQDVPFLITHTPSITSYSDSGTGNNYSYFSLRGISQTRINMTLDGAPLNDPAENALYFTNFGDFTSYVDSIQIQRGVGTSTVGSPSYGGSINFESARLTEDSETRATIGLGSYGTARASAAWQSGWLENGLALYLRTSFNDTEGYRDHSGVRQNTLFLSAAYRGERSELKLTSFSGRERTQLSFLAVDPATLADHPRANPLAEAERDRFGQDFAQLRYTRALDSGSTLSASLYYNGAQGWFRLWDDREAGPPVAQNDLLEFSIDGHTLGSMISLNRDSGRLRTTWGFHVNDFRRDHFLDVEGARQYVNTGFKREANAFVKIGYDLDRWHLFADAQVRHADFRYRGDVDLGSVDWTFFDPKVGVRYRLSDSQSLYASLGKASREPTRSDLLAGEDNATVVHDLEAVRPERVVDLEAGYDLRTHRLSLAANLYAMEFRNEIAATGELSEIGLPLRRNVDRSFRRGLELDFRWSATPHWTLTLAANLSRNRIREWTQFYDVYDAAGNWLSSEPRLHNDVPPLLTPEVIVNPGVRYGRGDLSLALQGRYVGASHLDNTGQDFHAPSYSQLDFRGSLRLQPWPALAGTRVSLQVLNLLDRDDLYPSGYSYLFFNRAASGRDAAGRDTLDGIPFYYPLADRHFVLTLDFKL